MKKLLNDAERIQVANDLFTNILIYMETGDKTAAKEAISECYNITISIEQRLALNYLSSLIEEETDTIRRIFEKTYDIN